MPDAQYEIRFIISGGAVGPEPMTFLMAIGTASPAELMPPSIARRYIEHAFTGAMHRALDQLFGPERPITTIADIPRIADREAADALSRELDDLTADDLDRRRHI